MSVVTRDRSCAVDTKDRSVERSRRCASPKVEWLSTDINQSDVLSTAQRPERSDPLTLLFSSSAKRPLDRDHHIPHLNAPIGI
jgi:hypothetical protein